MRVIELMKALSDVPLMAEVTVAAIKGKEPVLGIDLVWVDEIPVVTIK